MRAGKLRHKIQILTITTTQDDYGAEIQSEVVYKEVFAEIKPISGGEKFLANQRYPEATTSIRFRYFDGLDTNMRIAFGTRRFDIQNIVNTDEKNYEYFVIAKEIFA